MPITPPQEELIQKLAQGTMVAILAGLIRVLLTKQEPLLVRLRIFFAGVLSGLLLSFIFRNSTLSEFSKEIIIGASSAFVSTIWPIVEKLAIKWLNKKGNNVLSSDGD